MQDRIEIDWWPQPRQLVCLKACGLDAPFTGDAFRPAIADVIGYGGSAGGGKTDSLLLAGIIACFNYPGLNVGYFRREFPQLEGPGGVIIRSQSLISQICKYNDQKHRWVFPGGSILQFCHCKDPADVYNYQSQQFDILLIDEVTQFTREMVKYLLTRNRATVDYSTFKPFALFATNPGNVGHAYFKEEFVTLGPAEQVNVFVNEAGHPEKHIFIPSKLWDNEILLKRDPSYPDRVGNTELNRRMLLEGDWDVFAGQAFAELRRDIHVVEPFPVPKHWRKFGAYDHGFNHPFSFGVYAVNDDGIVYRIAGAKQRLKRVDEIARIMDEVSDGVHTLEYIVAGHDCWSKQRDGGPTIAEQFLLTTPKVVLTPANIDRIQGANQVRKFIAWRGAAQDENGQPADGKPRFYIFASCASAYDTLSQMLFDESHPEDVKKMDADEAGRGGDDEYDEVRYALMSRPAPASQKERKPPANSVLGYIRKKEKERWLKEEYVSW